MLQTHVNILHHTCLKVSARPQLCARTSLPVLLPKGMRRHTCILTDVCTSLEGSKGRSNPCSLSRSASYKSSFVFRQADAP
jgi:hypothetical protein